MDTESETKGFRVVAIPEPATGLMLALGAGMVALARRRQA